VTSEGLPKGTEGVAAALQRLVVFGVDQSGAYRELFRPIAEILGSSVPTRLINWLSSWAASDQPGLVVLTGNAGTGKTAAAEEFCRVLGSELPMTDELVEVAGALIAKDVSGIATRSERAEAFREVLRATETRKALVCANEGVLRDAVEDLADEHPVLTVILTDALISGASRRQLITIVNVNRQRLTAPDLWEKILDYLSAAHLWEGCDECPQSDEVDQPPGCPLRANADAMRRNDVRSVLRLLVQLASGEAVPTMREMLAVLAYGICGDASGDAGDSCMWSCEQIRSRARDRGRNAFTASSAYFNSVFGLGLGPEVRERSALLSALSGLGAGVVSDLEVDDWLRDAAQSDSDVRRLAGTPSRDDDGALSGSRSNLDRVRTAAGEMTFHRLGETVSISEDQDRVGAGIRALVAGEMPAQQMWRRRILFEGSASLGGIEHAVARLTSMRYVPDLIRIANQIAAGEDVVSELKQIMKGLNFLVTGFADASEGLIVPEPASLFARNPGSFRLARPAFVHTKLETERLRLEVPDVGLVAEILDVDHVEVRLVVDDAPDLALTITPRIYQALREAERFRGPVGHGTAEMTDLRSFYGRLADLSGRETGMQVADPSRAALVRVRLPHFTAHA
jgi:hypothetical protein